MCIDNLSVVLLHCTPFLNVGSCPQVRKDPSALANCTLNAKHNDYNGYNGG